MGLVGEQQERVPEYLDLLACVVKVQQLNVPLKRNQAYVMKFIMQSYNKVAYLFDQPREMRCRNETCMRSQRVALSLNIFRESILTREDSENKLVYLRNLVYLLATCAEVTPVLIE